MGLVKVQTGLDIHGYQRKKIFVQSPLTRIENQAQDSHSKMHFLYLLSEPGRLKKINKKTLNCIFFFFLIDKKHYIEQKKTEVPRSTQEMYKREPQGKQETEKLGAAKKPTNRETHTKGQADIKKPH